MNRFNLIPIFSILLVFGGSTISDAYAYIDPGSGSVMIQGLIGALVGAGIAIKLYWAKIRMALETKFSKS